jgi:Ca-activated chloride channel family protein
VRFAILISILSAGCKADSDIFDVDGVTPGGSQDVGLARDIIAQGGVPTWGTFEAEGLLSEHDLPLPEQACAEVLCPATSSMVTSPVDGSGEQLLVQLGFHTKYENEPFERPPLDLALVVDVSGSMSADGKMASTKTALQTLAERLDEGDRVSLVEFSTDSRVVMPLTTMDETGLALLREEIRGLAPDGTTNIEAGLLDGYGELEPLEADPARMRRVMLFTDAQPNVGSTEPGSFLGIVRSRADLGIGISVFGVGLDLGAELAREIAETRGGNSFYLLDAEAIQTVFDDNFGLIVTPVAYDLVVHVSPIEGYEVSRSWGVPVDGPTGGAELSASTLFLSEGDGGMGLSFVAAEGGLPEGGDPVALFDLQYLEHGGELVTDEVFLSADAEPADGVRKMAALVDEVLGLEGGATFCEGELTREEAEERALAAAAHLTSTAEALAGDPDLYEEASLMEQLADNLAGQGPCM